MMMGRCKIRRNVPLTEELKQLIVATARKHFAQHGFQGASLKAIAEEVGVANSLINYHFGDKEGLFKICLETVTRSQMQTVLRILVPPKSEEELRVRLEMFIDEMIISVLADPYGFEILDREMRFGNAAVLELFQNTLLKAFQHTVEFIGSAQKSGFFRRDLDPLLMASFLFTSTCDVTRKDYLAKRYFEVSFSQPEWRKKFIQQLMGLILNGAMA